MTMNFHRQIRALRVLAVCAISMSGLCMIGGCNSNESGGQHVVLTDFGTGQESTALFPRRDVGPEATVAVTTPVAKAPEVKKPAAKKPAIEKPMKKVAAVSKPAVKSPVPETPVVKKPAVETPVAKKPATETPVAKKTVEAKPVAKKPAAKKPVAKKPAPKKPAPKTEVALAPKPKPTPAPADDAGDVDDKGRPVLADGTGGFSGVITFDGKAPEPKFLYQKGGAPKDPEVCGLEAIPDQSLIVNQENNGVKNVFVYLRKKPRGFKPKPPKEALVFDQKYCVFLPHNLIVYAGREVLVKNGDPIVHNTHTNPVRNPGFNSAIGADDRVGVKLLYRRPESLPVKVVCDLHAWMSAYHSVLDHPFCASTDENGKFAIPNLPPGKYTFTVWQEKPGYLTKSLKVTVKAGEYTEEPLKYAAKDFAQHNGPTAKVLVLNTGR
ncbi:carboxypeptidase regulatory-like domain-containing protein [Symmachiella dynata]|uniref:carboxypeptidase regulatory-like domain-containing protein n=1 Tax=Symmachiella dynata TaxID=2527995 RepID=UPI0030ED9715